MYMKVEKGGAEKITVETLLSYEGMIRTTAAKYLGKQFGGWAADVTQDVLVKAWTRQDKYLSSKGLELLLKMINLSLVVGIRKSWKSSVVTMIPKKSLIRVTREKINGCFNALKHTF